MLHRHTHPRLARRRALGEHVKKVFAPFIVRSRLYDLVACDDIKFYPNLVWVTYDDLELVATLIVTNHVVMLLMIVIKPCDTSMPKATLVCVDMMVGLGVSHGSMYIMNPFFLDDFSRCKFKIK